MMLFVASLLKDVPSFLEAKTARSGYGTSSVASASGYSSATHRRVGHLHYL
jgi:hypothetical protein